MAETGKQKSSGFLERVFGIGREEVVVLDPFNENMFASAANIGGNFASELALKGVPEEWDEQGKQAWLYYLQEPIVNNAINAWRGFAIGDEISVNCSGNEEFEQEARRRWKEWHIEGFVSEMILQLLVKGEMIAYRHDDREDGEQLQVVNPVSVKIETGGDSVNYTQKTADGDEIELNAENLFRRKWNSPSFNERGNSMILPAFESIELLRDFRRAERAIAKRWTTPLRLITVGGKFGDKVVMPTQKMLEDVKGIFDTMNMKQGAVVPFWVEVKTYGADGEVLKTEGKITGTKEDIVVALGFVKSLITGDGPNFATAQAGLRKVVRMLAAIKRATRELLDWVFEDLLDEDTELQYVFNDADLLTEEGYQKLLIEMYDRSLISKKTLQRKLGLNAATEKENQKDEGATIKPTFTMQDLNMAYAQGVMSLEEVRNFLQLKGKLSGENPSEDEVETAVKKIKKAAQSGPNGDPMQTHAATHKQPALCESCVFFDPERNWCEVDDEETAYDGPACVSFQNSDSVTVTD